MYIDQGRILELGSCVSNLPLKTSLWWWEFSKISELGVKVKNHVQVDEHMFPTGGEKKNTNPRNLQQDALNGPLNLSI